MKKGAPLFAKPSLYPVFLLSHSIKHIDIRLVALRDWNSLFSFSANNKKQILRGIYLPEYWPSCSKILTPLARMHSLESSSRVSCFAVSITSFKTNIKHQLFMKKMPQYPQICHNRENIAPLKYLFPSKQVFYHYKLFMVKKEHLTKTN